MTDHRSQIVKRVMRSLEEVHDPESLVRAYFEDEREVLIEAARETIEATGEETTYEKVSEAVDHELLEALRFPTSRRVGVLPLMAIHRGVVSLAVAVLAALGALFLLMP